MQKYIEFHNFVHGNVYSLILTTNYLVFEFAVEEKPSYYDKRKLQVFNSVAPEPRLGSESSDLGSSFWSKSSARLGSLNFSQSSF